MLEDSVTEYGHLFPGLVPIAMKKILEAYVESVEQNITGEIIRVYHN